MRKHVAIDKLFIDRFRARMQKISRKSQKIPADLPLQNCDFESNLQLFHNCNFCRLAIRPCEDTNPKFRIQKT